MPCPDWDVAFLYYTHEYFALPLPVLFIEWLLLVLSYVCSANVLLCT